MNSQTTNKLWTGAKVLIAIVAVILIFFQLQNKSHFDLFIENLKKIDQPNKLVLIAVVVVLMICNWCIESLKWKILIKDFARVTFSKSFRATLTGVTVSFFTPNRVGEFIGRVMHLEPGARVKSALVTIIGSFSQLVITIILGNMAIGFCIGDFFELSSSVVILVRVALILFSAVVVFLFYEIQFFERLILKWKLTKRFSKYLEAYEHIGRVELTQVLALSFLRYMIYATQFVLLMQLFDLNYSLSKMYLSIMLTLYGITLVPTVAISEPAVRASVAGRILGVYNDKSDLIMVATLSLWFVNLVIPAVFGAITLLNIKLKSK